MSSRTDLLVRISELYYQQNLSQQDISKITGISRPTISRLLDEAKETGVVEIIVHSPINKNPQLSHLVRTTFGLRDAVIVAGDYEFDQSLTRCAHCAVDFLSTVLENNMSIGISWGRALEALCDVLEPTDYSDYYNVTVVQMVGCLGTGNPRVDGLELALRLSKKVHGTYSNIYAPVYVDSELVYSYLTAEPQIEATLKKAGSVDIILTGIGSLNDANGSLYKSGCYNAEERKELMRRGAVSSLLGRMFDINGNEVQLDSRYVISAPLEAMRTRSASTPAPKRQSARLPPCAESTSTYWSRTRHSPAACWKWKALPFPNKHPFLESTNTATAVLVFSFLSFLYHNQFILYPSWDCLLQTVIQHDNTLGAFAANHLVKAVAPFLQRIDRGDDLFRYDCACRQKLQSLDP